MEMKNGANHTLTQFAPSGEREWNGLQNATEPLRHNRIRVTVWGDLAPSNALFRTTELP